MNFIIYTLILLILIYWADGKRLKISNSLILRKNPGEELDKWLKDFSFTSGAHVLPRYKFYSGVVEEILSIARKVGGSFSDSFLFLRAGLREDLQFEKKVREVSMGLWLQLLLMAAITWSFIFFAMMITKVQVSSFKLFLILTWQTLGALLIPVTIRVLRKRYFQNIAHIWKMLYVLKSLGRTPLARSEVFQIAGIDQVDKIHTKSLLSLLEKVKELCRESLKFGKSYEEDLKNIMEELRFTENWHFSLFEKRLTGLKIIVLGLFFLPGYLSFIFFLVEGLNL